jgi:dTDP-4-amino-4,6-dideoxygalactose transaminase
MAGEITARRLAIWIRYHETLADLEAKGLATRPKVSDGQEHNGHLYYLVLPTPEDRDAFIDALRA